MSQINDSVEHVPAGMLARWDRLRDELGDFERRMIESHLDSCAECREDLEILRATAPASRDNIVSIERPRRKSSRLAWWTGSAGLALAASLLLALFIFPLQPPQVDPAAGAEGGAVDPVAALPAFEILGGMLQPNLRLVDRTRGEGALVGVSLTPDEPLRITGEMTLSRSFDDATATTLTLRGPGDRVFVAATTTLGELRRAGRDEELLIVLRSPGPWIDGRYTVEVRDTDGELVGTADFRLTVETTQR